MAPPEICLSKRVVKRQDKIDNFDDIDSSDPLNRQNKQKHIRLNLWRNNWSKEDFGNV